MKLIPAQESHGVHAQDHWQDCGHNHQEKNFCCYFCLLFVFTEKIASVLFYSDLTA